MVNNRGVVLVFSLLLTPILSSLLGALYLNAVSESLQANQYANSTRAFWLAEAGLATVKANPGLGAASGSLGGANYTYNVPSPQLVTGTTNYWIVTSTGTVSLPSGVNISRTLSTTVKTGAIDSSKFPYAIDTTADLVIRGNVTINGVAKENDATINFANMFGISKTTMEAGATHLYTDSNFAAPVDGITWVNVASGNNFAIAGNLEGSGILIINGDVRISGTIVFDGIIYVIGALTMTGTITTNGSVIAESSLTADTELMGTVNVNYDLTQIESALAYVQLLNKQIVSWREE
ncbi:MAG: hypothetical protein COV73_01025 [Candidatus Omnitrophica bacterium CG11_big_fil_rev_8_21_14_0_20_43_6]|nr:MAG: hypothetical protein COV73_01025 [Candidatus Omnitrophica bacterium CG11_big_fil_rev_8_21_14_0_20_43_6]